MNKEKGIAHIILLPVIAFLIIAGLAVYVTQNRSSVNIVNNIEQGLAEEKSQEITSNKEVATTDSEPVPESWEEHSFGKPMGISLLSPSDYSASTTKPGEEVWNINLSSESGIRIEMCVGCMLNKAILTCGHSSGPAEEYKCKVTKSVELPNGEYTVEVFKSDENKLAHITGVLFKDSGMDIPIVVTTEDNRIPSDKEFETLNNIFASVKDK